MTEPSTDLDRVVLEGEVVVDAQEPGHDVVERGHAEILPVWVASRAALGDALHRTLGRTARLAAFHGLRIPVYWCRLAVRSPYGAARLLGRVHRWQTNTAAASELRELVAAGFDGKAAKVVLERNHDIARRRLRNLRLALLPLLPVVAISIAMLPWQAWVVLAAVTLPVLGAAGRTSTKRITSRSVTSDDVPRFTTGLILTALGSLGIGELNKALAAAARTGQDGIGWPSEIAREGKGWRAEIDLPAGVTATQIIDKRDQLASGLRRTLASVWPEGDPEVHAARLVLYVSDRPLAKTKQGAWPLAATGKVNLFEPFPIGVNPRAGVVMITLMYVAMIIGAIPRMGKTFTMRLILLAAALDPRVELHVYDLKGGADLLPLEPISYRFRVGDDAEDLDYLVRDLTAIQEEMRRRYKIIRSLPRDLCPEGKVTDQLASMRRYGLHPIVIAKDEAHIAYEDNTRKDVIQQLSIDISKRGPAAGIIFIDGTQKPDAQSIPTAITSNAALRFCLKVMSERANNMILGPGSYGAGIRATQFARSEQGVGYLVGEGDDPQIVRTYYVDGPAAEKVVARARQARVAAGTLLGHAAGQDDDVVDEVDASTILDHLLAAWPLADNGEPQPRIRWDQAAQALADRDPYYVDITAKAVREGTGLESHQINRKVDGNQVNRRGPAHADLIRVLAARDAELTTTTEDS